MRVAFRLDANAHVGQGHLMRSAVLARALARRGHGVSMLVRPLAPALQAQLIGCQLAPVAEHSDGLAELGQLASEQPLDWLVVDHYGLDAQWEDPAREHAKHILVIDDLANRPHDCDALLDQNIPNALQARHGPWLPAKCRQWLGLDHLLAREAFYEAPPGPRSGLLVFLGGGDQRAALAGLLAQLQTQALPAPLHLLLTAAYGPAADWQQAAGPGAVLHQDLPEPAGLCGRMQGAIVRCGFMAYELALLGTPMVLLHATPIQAEVALALQTEGRAVALAEEALAQPGALAQALAAMHELRPLPMNQVRRPGAERVARLMENFDD